MKWLQALRSQFPQHKYAINAKLLGDDAVLAWSNLGYWQADADAYPQACQALAEHLAQAIQLNAHDRLLDLGCGQGASLQLWLKQFKVQRLYALEMQPACIEKIKKELNSKAAIYCASFLNLKTVFPQTSFDAVLCIDAAYHSPLNSFLRSVQSVLNSKGRLGFHYLMLSDEYLNSNALQKLKYRALLKAADVNLSDLLSEKELYAALESSSFKNIQIEDISAQVFAGFAHYAETALADALPSNHLDIWKIRMTAKLCRTLYAGGAVRYVQIAAQKG
ncbi:SAM-dependent methyltransferase [Acinetobacter pragensis]|uniref:SAM-dependent methyltransferase n=1 Tax=Acinetobacter pragensis TaxID=1806892 RepID=UPI0033403188